MRLLCPSCMRADGVRTVSRPEGDAHCCSFCGLSWHIFKGTDRKRVDGAMKAAALTLDAVSHLSCCPASVLDFLALLRGEICARALISGDF